MQPPEFAKLETEHCCLNEGRIDIWCFSLKQVSPHALQMLNAEEQARATRFYFEKHQRRFTAAHSTMRIILSEYLNIPANRLEFHANRHGKPGLTDPSQIQFNLSHSQDTALLAVGQHYPLGIDIEYYSDRPYDGMAKNAFSLREVEQFLQVPQALKVATFFHIWSQKEAFIKASGLGLAYPTQDFDVPLTMPTRQLIDDPLHRTTWQLHSFMPDLACSAALCHHPSITDIRYGEVKLDWDDRGNLWL